MPQVVELEEQVALSAKKIAEVSASDMIEDEMRVYADDLVSRQYPHVIDGLKKVQRRILWVIGNSDNTVGLNAIIGQAEDIHTSGDSSIYSALVRLNQPFHVGHPLIEIDGNGGSYPHDRAAHPRYIKAKATEFGKDVLFNRCISKALPLVHTKNFDNVEPLYFIPCIPTALLYSHLTIGIGFKSQSPQLNLNNLCDLVMKHVEYKTKTFHIQVPPKVAAKYLIPDFPIQNYLMNYKELLKAYENGDYEAPIMINGKILIEDNSIILKACAFGSSYTNTYETLTKRLADMKNKFWLLEYLKGYEDLSTKIPKFKMTFKNNIDIFATLNKIKPLLAVEDVFYPKYYYTYADTIIYKNPLELLSLWYDERCRSILSGIKYRHMNYAHQKLEKQAKLIICENSDKVISIVKHSDNVIRELTDTFPKLTQAQARIIKSAPLDTLSKLSKLKLLDDIEKIDASIKDILSKYTNIDETVYNDAQYMKKKYGKPRITTYIDNMIGYITVGNTGVIQYESPEELYTLLESNPGNNKDIKIHSFHNYLPNKVAYFKSKMFKYKYSTIPKEFHGTAILEYPNNPYTFCRVNDSTSLIDGIKFPNSDKELDQIQYTTKDGYGITLDGQIIELDKSDISCRKSICKGSKSNIINVIPKNCKDIVVIHMHPLEPNTVRIDRILHNKELGKCVFIPTNELQILDIQPITANFVALNLPESCMNKSTLKYLIIENIQDMFKDDNSTQIIQLTKQNRKLKKHDNLSKLMILKG